MSKNNKAIQRTKSIPVITCACGNDMGTDAVEVAVRHYDGILTCPVCRRSYNVIDEDKGPVFLGFRCENARSDQKGCTKYMKTPHYISAMRSTWKNEGPSFLCTGCLKVTNRARGKDIKELEDRIKRLHAGIEHRRNAYRGGSKVSVCEECNGSGKDSHGELNRYGKVKRCRECNGEGFLTKDK